MKNWKAIIDSRIDQLASENLAKPSPTNRVPFFGIRKDMLKYGDLNLYLLYKKYKNGEPVDNSLVSASFNSADLRYYKNHDDKNLVSSLVGYASSNVGGWSYEGVCNFPADIEASWLSRLAQMGRLYYFSGGPATRSGLDKKYSPINLKDGIFSVFVRVAESDQGFSLVLGLKNNSEEIEFDTILKVFRSGVFLGEDFMGIVTQEQVVWTLVYEPYKSLVIPKDDEAGLVEFLFAGNLPALDHIELPEGLGWKKIKSNVIQQGKLVIESVKAGSKEQIMASLYYVYGSDQISAFRKSENFVDLDKKLIYERNLEQEQNIYSQLFLNDSLSVPAKKYSDRYQFTIKKSKFTSVVRELVNLGWDVVAYGKPIKSASAFALSVSSGIDWFELQVDKTVENKTGLSLPQLIKASQNSKDGFVELGDGSMAMMPEKWLNKYTTLSEMGKTNGEAIRFKKSQGLLLDGFLDDTQEDISFDLDFKKFQKKLKTIKLKKQKVPAQTFKGELRDYQKAGLSWLEYLNQFEMGGILADDMGLGKTVQVLAFLQKIIKAKSSSKNGGSRWPHLLVVPKSLVLNWQAEAERFTPNLKVLPYVGANRQLETKEIFSHDIVIVTYHTLRSDFEKFKDVQFNYVILDEAQAIKNEQTQISRVVKKINAQNRLALTGTPIENSILDLFSIVNFTNPGLISNSMKDSFSSGVKSKDPDSEGLKSLNKALAPLILRRKKEAVLKDLPDKEVTTLICDLSKKERKQYNDLKNYYQKNLSKKIAEKSFDKSKIYILEALLRLRQAACHPGLIDQSQKNFESAKLSVLLENIEKVVSRGHKCLVFSQFTKFLKIAQDFLTEKAISYCYLDGRTTAKNRQKLVDEFNDSDTESVFLISLKAGGTGLNLTRADYVFILDPWWNPAAEMQAIDRSHRIGQKNKVFAYKLIAKNTVEEKILQLQKSKKDLSDAVVNSGQGLLKKLSMEDLNFLLK